MHDTPGTRVRDRGLRNIIGASTVLFYLPPIESQGGPGVWVCGVCVPIWRAGSVWGVAVMGKASYCRSVKRADTATGNAHMGARYHESDIACIVVSTL